MKPGIAAAVVIALFVAVGSAKGTTPNTPSSVNWYVDPNATGPTHGGTTWCAAFTTLQDALSAASSASSDKIFVANGTYKPDQGGGQIPGNRAATFTLKQNVVLEGGYAGCGAPNPNERDVVAYESVLSGDLSGNDGPNFANIAENSIHVVTGASTNTAVLDGFTIRGGNANGGPTETQGYGGGIINVSQGSTVVNCRFIANFAMAGAGSVDSFSAGDAHLGASEVADSVVVDGTSTLTLDDTTLLAPTCVGLISLLAGDGVVSSSLTVYGGTIRANAPGQALVLGGLASVRDAHPLVTSFEAVGGGTLSLISGATPGCASPDCLATLTATSGTILAGDLATIQVGTVTLNAGGRYQANPNEPGADAAVLNAGSVTIYEGLNGGSPGAMTLTGSMLAGVTGHLRLIAPVGIGGPSDTPPILDTRSSARVEVGGDLFIQDAALIDYASTSPLLLTGNFDNRSVASGGFDWRDGGVVLQNPATSPAVVFEAAGRDRGPGVFGTDAEYEMGSVRVVTGKQVTVKDAFDNDALGQTPCSEALYVDTLSLDAGATLIVQNVHVYYRNLVNSGGTITLSGCGSLIRRTDTIFGQTVTARRYCEGSPQLTCTKDSDCGGVCKKAAFEWATSVSFVYATGNFTSASGIGLYTVASSSSGSGQRLLSPTDPSPGSGAWYLFKLGCPSGNCSWQDGVGDEPQRDAVLP